MSRSRTTLGSAPADEARDDTGVVGGQVGVGPVGGEAEGLPLLGEDVVDPRPRAAALHGVVGLQSQRLDDAALEQEVGRVPVRGDVAVAHRDELVPLGCVLLEAADPVRHPPHGLDAAAVGVVGPTGAAVVQVVGQVEADRPDDVVAGPVPEHRHHAVLVVRGPAGVATPGLPGEQDRPGALELPDVLVEGDRVVVGACRAVGHQQRPRLREARPQGRTAEEPLLEPDQRGAAADDASDVVAHARHPHSLAQVERRHAEASCGPGAPRLGPGVLTDLRGRGARGQGSEQQDHRDQQNGRSGTDTGGRGRKKHPEDHR